VEADAAAYYERLAGDYPLTIRQLVPRYDEMVGEIAGRLRRLAPRRIVDVGCGPGEVTALIADALPGSEIIAVEVNGAMVEAARTRLAPFGDRVRVLHADARELVLPGPIQAAFSNLVLHNLGGDDKVRALKAVRGAVSHGGVFLWGDLIRHEEATREASAVTYRRRFALEKGCPPDLVEWNFRKEGEQDHPLSLQGMTNAARLAGFHSVQRTWSHDGFVLIEAH
jgi:SAM-dependent methyltransferase